MSPNLAGLMTLSVLAACGNDPVGDVADAPGSRDGSIDGVVTPDGPSVVPLCEAAEASDDFERPTLGASWMMWVNSQCSIANNSDLAQASSNNWCYAAYSTMFAADQVSEAVISVDKPASILTQVFVRQQPVGVPNGNGARYGFHYNADPGDARWEIKYDGVMTAETRVWTNTTAAAPVPGDRIRIEVRGTDPVELRGLHNGVEILSVVDSSPQRIAVTGYSGVVERNAGGTSALPNSPVWESWCGGALP